MATSRTAGVSQVTNQGKTVTGTNQKVLSRRQKVQRDMEDMMLSGKLFQILQSTEVQHVLSRDHGVLPAQCTCLI